MAKQQTRGGGISLAALLFVAEAARAWREQERAAERRRGGGRRGWRRVGLQRRYSEAVHSSRGREQWRRDKTTARGGAPASGREGRRKMKAGLVLQYSEILGAELKIKISR